MRQGALSCEPTCDAAVSIEVLGKLRSENDFRRGADALAQFDKLVSYKC